MVNPPTLTNQLMIDGDRAAGHAGSYLTLSGTNPASGVSGVGNLSGPWYIEQQSLQIHYKRVPKWEFTHGDVNLSATNLEPWFAGTHMAVKCWPRVVKQKLYGDYATSTYFQPQRFTVYAVSSDYTGQSYGNGFNPTPTAGTLAVGGSIFTSQPYYFRREWTAQDDVDAQSWNYPAVPSDLRQWEAHPEHPAGANWASGIVYGYSYRPFNAQDCFVDALIKVTSTNGWNQMAHNFAMPDLGQVNFWATAAGAGAQNVKVQQKTGLYGLADCFANANPLASPIQSHGLLDNHRLAWKGGKYSYNLDSVDDTRIFVDTIGEIIAKSFQRLSQPDDYFLGSTGGNNLGQGIHGINNASYEKNRHYWGG